ncbi:MAG: ASCH domain-containing protein [Oscillospiraceae bacterium]|nr:ASCH domain-containing protein [Oscillospiraceae bacterium]
MKPILFNTEMVCAILDGRKTVTRRVVKPQYGGALEVHDDVGGVASLCERCGSLCKGLKPPYRPGDILYVRETWAAWSPTYGMAPELHYKANGENLPGLKWRPSIHMPREAARLFLRVTDVRVEQLQNITPEECISEGLSREPLDEVGGVFIRGMYADLWDSTIKPADHDLYGWDANPWVWVIQFERISKEEVLTNG